MNCRTTAVGRVQGSRLITTRELFRKVWRRRPDLNRDGGFADRAGTSMLLTRLASWSGLSPPHSLVFGRNRSQVVPKFLTAAAPDRSNRYLDPLIPPSSTRI